MLSRSGISVAETQLTTSWPCWVAALSEPKLSQLINCSWWLGSAQGVNFKSMSWVLLPFFLEKKLWVLYLTDLQIWVNWCQLLLSSSLAPSPPSPHCHSPFLTHMAVASVHPHLVCCCHCDLVIGSSASASSWLLVHCSECAWKCVHEKLCDRVQDW